MDWLNWLQGRGVLEGQIRLHGNCGILAGLKECGVQGWGFGVRRKDSAAKVLVRISGMAQTDANCCSRLWKGGSSVSVASIERFCPRVDEQVPRCKFAGRHRNIRRSMNSAMGYRDVVRSCPSVLTTCYEGFITIDAIPDRPAPVSGKRRGSGGKRAGRSGPVRQERPHILKTAPMSERHVGVRKTPLRPERSRRWASSHEPPCPEGFSREKASPGFTNGCGSVVREISL